MISAKTRQIFALALLVVATLTLAFAVRGRRGREVQSMPPERFWTNKADSGDVAAQCVAIRKIGAFTRPEQRSRGLPVLVKKLNHGHVAARIAAAEMLGRYRDPRAVDPLIRAIQDENPQVATNVIGALGEIGDPRALQPLKALLVPRGRGFAAARAIARLNTPQAEDVLIEALTTTRDPWIIRGALRGLARCGTDKAVKALQAFLDTPRQGLDPELLAALFPDGTLVPGGGQEPTPRVFREPCRRVMAVIKARLKQKGGASDDAKG